MRRWESDADRIATIVERLDRNQRVWGPDIAWLVDALDTAQAESDFQHHRADAFCKAAMRREVENKNLETERDRLTNQITDLTEALTVYREARQAMVQAVQSGHAAPQSVTSQILAAEAQAGRVLSETS